MDDLLQKSTEMLEQFDEVDFEDREELIFYTFRLSNKIFVEYPMKDVELYGKEYKGDYTLDIYRWEKAPFVKMSENFCRTNPPLYFLLEMLNHNYLFYGNFTFGRELKKEYYEIDGVWG